MFWEGLAFFVVGGTQSEIQHEQRQRNMKELRNMSPKPYDVNVYRAKKWTSIPTTDILPGDIISSGMCEGQPRSLKTKDEADHSDSVLL